MCKKKKKKHSINMSPWQPRCNLLGGEEGERWKLRESDGEKGIEKHLPSLLESRGVITG